jgi:hypothetical protein
LEKPNQRRRDRADGRNGASRTRRGHRLQQPHLAGALDAAGIGRDEDVARALVASVRNRSTSGSGSASMRLILTPVRSAKLPYSASSVL